MACRPVEDEGSGRGPEMGLRPAYGALRTYIYIYIYICICMYVYIYIYM